MKKHWTPGYIFNRTKNYFFEKYNQHLPWLTPDSIELLNNLIKKTDVGILGLEEVLFGLLVSVSF